MKLKRSAVFIEALLFAIRMIGFSHLASPVCRKFSEHYRRKRQARAPIGRPGESPN